MISLVYVYFWDRVLRAGNRLGSKAALRVRDAPRCHRCRHISNHRCLSYASRRSAPRRERSRRSALGQSLPRVPMQQNGLQRFVGNMDAHRQSGSYKASSPARRKRRLGAPVKRRNWNPAAVPDGTFNGVPNQVPNEVPKSWNLIDGTES